MIRWLRGLPGITCGVALVLMAAVVLVQVFFRYVLNNSLFWSEELARYLQIFLTFIGAAIALRKGLLVGLDALAVFLKGRLRKGVLVFNMLLNAVFSVVLLVYGGKLILQQIEYGQSTAALGIPIFYIYSAIPLGGLFLLMECIIQTIELVRSENGIPAEIHADREVK